jgi:hypothetical protein
MKKTSRTFYKKLKLLYYDLTYYKWYFIYIGRYFKSLGAIEEVKQFDWFLGLNDHRILRKIWRYIHGM